jgi:hypothetical protein
MKHPPPFAHVWTPFWTTALPVQLYGHGSCHIQMLGLTKEPALRHYCSIPENKPLFRVTVEEPQGAHGYSVSIVGFEAGDSASPDAPKLSLLGEPDTVVLLAAQRCVWHIDTHLWLEALWRPETGTTIAMHGLEQRHRSRELQLIRYGLLILRNLEMGRNRETSRYYPKEKFVVEYPRAYGTAERRMRPDPVRQEDVARVMNISAETFKRYLGDYQCLWPPALP